MPTPLREFIDRYPRLCVLTGAGVSTSSGIPDYRDEHGEWKRARPVEFRPFMTDPRVRQRYWSRSTVGWPIVAAAQPSASHRALATLEAEGIVQLLITQNVDGLHAAAGSRNVIDLHGRLDVVRCMQDGAHLLPRAELQRRMLADNPTWADVEASVAPDGDVDLARDYSGFVVPDCPRCGGVLKPDVVFFGENVPPDRVARAFEGVANAEALLIVGSSLMVYSGYRFAEAAASAGKPIAAINLGRTRADHLISLKIERPCDEALDELSEEVTTAR